MKKEQSETGGNTSESSSDDGKEQCRKGSENDSAASSNGRDSGSGSGSGRGYNGDCSSDDASSSESSSKRKAAPELDASVQSMVINERHGQTNDEEIRNDKIEARKSKKAKDRLHVEDQQYNSWDVASATQVAVQISALAAIIEQNRKLAEESAVPCHNSILPQWNGIRISHPMDPRIDLRTVGHIPGSNVPVASNDGIHMHASVSAHQSVAPPTVDNYLNLMEAVRPYFHSYGFPMPPPPTDPSLPTPCENGVGSDNYGFTGSSEGFTAFFTSTEKSQSSDSSDHKSNNKSAEIKPVKGSSSTSGAAAELNEQGEAPNVEKENDNGNESDSSSSSMIVLARVKRKHQRRQHAEGDGDSNGSTGQPDSNEGSPSQARKDNEKSIQQHNPLAPGEAQESSSSSSSSDSNAHINMRHDGRHNFQQHHDGAGQAHIVSETNTASNTSGSGSGGNSGTNSGSGSNPGSSGSGNENPGSSGSGNEGKGSSDDAIAKDDNSGDGNPESLAMGVEKVESHVHRSPFAGDEYSQEDEMSRENRLLDKKRKRMNMRREYEEQVEQDLDSEDSPEEVEIRPGKPVTLDAVLSFTKIARVVIQSTPPFLVVHANAAFTALTAVDSHAIIGKPIRTLLSVPASKRDFMLTELDHSDGVHSGQSSMTNSATANRQDDQTGSAKEPVSGAHRQQYEDTNGIHNYEAAAAAGHARANSNRVVDNNVERLIAACGYGQIHALHVSTKPHHILGRNVTVFRETHRCTEQSEQGSHSSSLASNDAPFQSIVCRIGVSPVVSVSQGDLLSPQLVPDNENSNKRRKHHNQNPHRRHQRTTLVTHFCIQLEKAVPTTQENAQRPTGESLLSPSMATRKLAEAEQAYPQVAQNHEVDELSTQSSDQREPVTAIG